MAGLPADPSRLAERSHLGAGMGSHQPVTWRAEWKVEKFAAGAQDVRSGVYGTTAGDRAGTPVKPYEVIEKVGNLLVYGGADVLWLGLRDGLSASTGLANTRFNNANASIKVGDTNTAAAATQTDLAAPNTTTDRTFAGMEATYPTHTTGTATSTSSKITFRSVYSTAIGNFAWEEWGIFNRVTANTGRMLNRKAESLGTKTAAATWTFTVQLSLA